MQTVAAGMKFVFVIREIIAVQGQIGSGHRAPTRKMRANKPLMSHQPIIGRRETKARKCCTFNAIRRRDAGVIGLAHAAELRGQARGPRRT